MERMASVSNGIGLSSSIVSLLSFTIESCTALNRNIKSFKTKNRTVRELRGEGQDLESVLRTLEDSMNNVAVSMEFLKQPLNRCRDACKDFNALLTEFTEHPTDEEVSIGNWLKLRYMGEDIAGFKNMLAGYKSTITIALVYVNIQTTRNTKDVLDEYKELIETTKYDLESHLREIKDRLQAGTAEGPAGSDSGTSELQRMEEERDATQQCLKFCAKVSAYIEEEARSALPTAIMSPSSSLAEPRLPFLMTAEACNSAQKNFISSTLQLQRYLCSINTQAQTTLHRLPLPLIKQTIEQQSLESEVESITDSLSLCDKAADQENEIRRNFYEDITVGDDSQQYIVSLKDLISAKRVKAGDRSTQVMGQVPVTSLPDFSLGHYHCGGANGK